MAALHATGATNDPHTGICRACVCVAAYLAAAAARLRRFSQRFALTLDVLPARSMHSGSVLVMRSSHKYTAHGWAAEACAGAVVIGGEPSAPIACQLH